MQKKNLLIFGLILTQIKVVVHFILAAIDVMLLVFCFFPVGGQ